MIFRFTWPSDSACLNKMIFSGNRAKWRALSLSSIKSIKLSWTAHSPAPAKAIPPTTAAAPPPRPPPLAGAELSVRPCEKGLDGREISGILPMHDDDHGFPQKRCKYMREVHYCIVDLLNLGKQPVA
mmetsp:Transcript_157736/g.278465  ORF Transcript_157736/g.278465 Transcript_157736/m.278465 type:complete len:127 (+) Transcript_157736:1321-1701(+)